MAGPFSLRASLSSERRSKFIRALHWARTIEKLDHRVRLMPPAPNQQNPFVPGRLERVLLSGN